MARWQLRAARRLGMAVTGAALVSVLAVSTAFAGNNGTIKIHEMGTPEGTPNNDPKVCTFNVEGFGLDAWQTGWLYFSVQGGDAPTGEARFGGWVQADGDGYFESRSFGLEAGHYKATLYGKEDMTDVKAKSKVFKVTCECPGEGGGEEGGSTG